MRGFVKFELEDFRGAISDYNICVEINPKEAKAYLNRGIAKGFLGLFESGCLDFSKAGELGSAMAYELIKKYCK